jgi:hypothetical protein
MAALTFLGIGAQKTGTTWLHEMLKLHPAVGLPADKEQHFWDAQHAKGKSVADYDALFASMRQPVRGEITPRYAILPPETIALIRRHYPQLLLLFSLRNPMERAWSNAKMALLSREIVSSMKDVDRVNDAWYIDHFRSELSLQRGDYETCLRNWLDHFDQEQLLISFYEDLQRDPRGYLAHIGTDPSFYTSVPDSVLAQRIGTTEFGAIRPSLFPVLKDLYAPKIASLSAYLGRDFSSLWLG